MGGTWYYLNPDTAVMQTGFIDINGATYYLNSSGAMKTGWLKAADGYQYYFYSSGKMARDAWIGSYYVDADGHWVPGAVKE